MTTLPPHALNGNPQVIYALADSSEHVTWKDVFYVGMTVNPAQRLERHLSCTDRVNLEKNQHIQTLLIQGKTPRMLELEKVTNVPMAREREQYWIRYAMEQGSNLTNYAITYTAEERIEASQYRAVRNAWVTGLLAQGIYVKRYGRGYPGRLLDPYKIANHLTLVQARYCHITLSDGKMVSVEGATDAEFDAFIREYIPIEDHGTDKWFVGERCQALDFACYLEMLAYE